MGSCLILSPCKNLVSFILILVSGFLVDWKLPVQSLKEREGGGGEEGGRGREREGK